MAHLIPYINFERSADAVDFYKVVFGGDAEIQRDGDRVVHFDFRAGEVHFMGSDLGIDEPGQASSVVLDCDNEDQLQRLYAGLVDGGTEVFAPTDSGWGAVIAHCVDRFAVTWLLNFDHDQG